MVQQVSIPERQRTAPVNEQRLFLSKRRLGVIGLFTVLMLACGYEAIQESADATYAANWWLVGMLVMAAVLLLAVIIGNKSLD